jgi:hypothetical protein
MALCSTTLCLAAVLECLGQDACQVQMPLLICCCARAHNPPTAPGYVAGWLSAALPTSCQGLSARACYACQGLATVGAVSGCLTCAKQSAPEPMGIFFNGINAITRAETCAYCHNTTGANSEAWVAAAEAGANKMMPVPISDAGAVGH